MSDDQSPPTPSKAIFSDYPLSNPKDPDNDSEPQQPDQGNKEPELIGPEDLNPSPNKKRKGVNFEHPKATKKGKEPMKVQPVAGQPEKEPEEHPNKVSKHIHKWTYSRVHSSATEIQQEQIRVPAHTAKADRRSSPKGLFSASSAPAVTCPKTRNRGRRRGRGMSPISSAVFAGANRDLQVSNTMRASWKAECAQPRATRYHYLILFSDFLTVSFLHCNSPCSRRFYICTLNGWYINVLTLQFFAPWVVELTVQE